jgi:hypothetical protein
MSNDFKTSGSISMREINDFIDEYSDAPTPSTRDAKSVDDSFDMMSSYKFELPNGNFTQPHQLSEIYGAVPPLTAWNLPRIACWGRIYWYGIYQNIPWRIGEYNTTKSTDRDTEITFTTIRSTISTSSGDTPGGRFVSYRATSYAKAPGVAHPLPTEIKNENRKYGLWAANSAMDWGRIGFIQYNPGGGWVTDEDLLGPSFFIRRSSTSTYAISKFLNNPALGSYSSSPASSPLAAIDPSFPNPETKTIQDALMFWDTNSIPYPTPGWVAAAGDSSGNILGQSQIQGYLEHFGRFNDNSDDGNPHYVSNNTAKPAMSKPNDTAGLLNPSSTDFHTKIQGSNSEGAGHIILEQGSYTQSNGIFDEYDTIYYQTGIIYIRDDQSTGNLQGLNINFDECPNGYVKIEVGASPEYLVLPAGSQWIVIGADDIIPSGSSFSLKSSPSYYQVFSNKAAAVAHWMQLHYGEHSYQMNANLGLYETTNGWSAPSSGTPGRGTRYFNQATKTESDWQFVLGQRTKGDSTEFPSYLAYDYYIDDSNAFNSLTSGYYNNIAKKPRSKGSKYKFDLLYDAFKKKNFFSSNVRLADENYMPRMHTGLKIEIKYIIELRMDHQIQIERAARYCEKLSSTNSFQILYVWPFDQDFAENYGASVPSYDPTNPSSGFVAIGHAVTANSSVKYLHINTAALESSTNLYSHAVTAIRNAFGV